MAKVELKKIKENKNGSATIEIEYDGDFETMIKNKLKVKKVTKQMIKDEFINGLLNYVKVKKDETKKKKSS